MPFLQLPILQPLDESGDYVTWKVIEPFAFESERFFPGKLYVVPKDFVTDLASVPRLIPGSGWWIGRAPSAAVLHDFLYQRGLEAGSIKSKGEADLIFLEAMLSRGINESIAHQMYYKVRDFGANDFHLVGDQVSCGVCGHAPCHRCEPDPYVPGLRRCCECEEKKNLSPR